MFVSYGDTRLSGVIGAVEQLFALGDAAIFASFCCFFANFALHMLRPASARRGLQEDDHDNLRASSAP